ncbi:MAG TPA: hypothetical protein VMO75_02820 [Chthoniobacterales bacterium]|nr:hypothetical protein [Chthoniobacterales bacterium]
MRQHARAAMVMGVWLFAVSQSSAQTVNNGSFEFPALPLNSFSYDPGGATWLFTADSGIINAPGGGFLGPAAPDGSQYAFLQSAFAPGTFSQSIDFTLAGTYQLSYLVGGRPNNGGPAGDLSYEILLDSTVIATDATTSGQPFTTRLFQFSTTAGSHTLSFEVAPGATGDNTAFFDQISIQVPEPTTALLLLTFAPFVRAIRRRH